MNGIDVKVPGTGELPETPAYASIADKPTRGIVVIHEIYGRQPEIDGVVDRFAANGYAAIAPDLFHAGKWQCMKQIMATMKTGKGLPVLQAQQARAWLCERTGLPVDKIGIIGFCMGGGFALAAGSGWAAVSTNYGEVPSTEVMRGIGPVIGCYGGKDRIFRNKGIELELKLEPLGTEVEIHNFKDVGHSFLTHGNHPLMRTLTWPVMHIVYEPEVAEEGWRNILAFFDKHLS